MRVFFLLLLIFVAGCASRGTLVWQHPDGLDDTQLQRAQLECRQLAHREARYPYFYFADPFFPFYRPFHYHDRNYPGDMIWRDHFVQMHYQEELSRLYRICMEAKGWSLFRVAPEQPGN